MGDRRKALEESFFHGVDAELLEQLKRNLTNESVRDSLSKATGITDEKVLQEIADLGITAETLAAISLVPSVAVAWADGTLEEKEREAILQAAQQEGISEPGQRILQGWLAAKPGDELLQAWRDYIQLMAKSIPAGEVELMKHKVLTQAERIAEAAGGILGMGKISAEERHMLKDLAKAFEA